MSPQRFVRGTIHAGRGEGGGGWKGGRTCVVQVPYSYVNKPIAAVDFRIRLCGVGLVNGFVLVLRGLSRLWLRIYKLVHLLSTADKCVRWTLRSSAHNACHVRRSLKREVPNIVVFDDERCCGGVVNGLALCFCHSTPPGQSDYHDCVQP